MSQAAVDSMRSCSCDLPTAICLACQWEVVAAKPGNVHRTADFHDIGLIDFLHSGLAVSNTARRWQTTWSATNRDAQNRDVQPEFGQFIRDAVLATRQLTGSNTNLGICLLLGPLAEVWARQEADLTRSGQAQLLTLDQWRLQTKNWIGLASVQQTQFIYQAINLAKPGGLGAVPEADVAAASELRDTDTVAYVMKLAANRDSIAAEFESGYALTFAQTVPSLVDLLSSGCGLQWAIVGTYLRLLAANPDTLIARKVGWDRAREISVWARQLTEEFFPSGLQNWEQTNRQEACEQSLAELDFALRCDGNRLNPGTTADLIVAGLFVALLSGQISLPVRW